MLKAIIFDFDGVIANSRKFNHDVLLYTAEKYGIKLDDNNYPTHFFGNTLYEGVTSLLKENKAEELYGEFIAEKKTFDEKFPLEAKPYLDTIEFINKNKNKYRLAIGTGARRSMLDPYLSYLKLSDAFEITICSDDVTNFKPHPETYLRVLDGLKISTNEALVIEDTPGGISAAKSGGLYCIAVTNTRPKHELVEADLIVDKLMDIDNLDGLLD